MNKKRLSVSIVIPAYNEESQLRSCLSAIAKQTDFPEEVIVVNNNSTDSTADIAKSFPFVRLVTERNQGLRFARNKGVALARGDIVGRIDADTRLSADWVANVRRLFTEDSEVMAATGPAYYHDMPLKQTSLSVDHFLRKSLFKAQKYPLLYGSNMAFRRQAWHCVLPTLCQDGEFFEDLDLTIHFKDSNHPMAYDEGLAVGVSARRMDDSPRVFYKNLKFYKHTFSAHGQSSIAASGARWIFLALYLPSKIVRKIYDAKLERFSLIKTRRELSPRPTSNT